MAASVRAQLASLPCMKSIIKDEKRRVLVGDVGALRCPPLVSVCALVEAIDVDWKGSREVTINAKIVPEVRQALSQPNSRFLLQTAHYSEAEGGIISWPFDSGRREVEIKTNGRFLPGDLDEDGHSIPSQTLLTIPHDVIGAQNNLKIVLSKVIEAAPPPGQKRVATREWGLLHTVVVVVTYRLEPMLLKAKYSDIREAKQIPASSELSMLGEVSFKDPMSSGRMQAPMVRGVQCTHLQCFDLSVYLQMAMTRGAFLFKWVCPVCAKPIYWSDLVRDAKLERLSKECPRVAVCRVDMARWGEPGYQYDAVIEEEHEANDSDSSESRDVATKVATKRTFAGEHKTPRRSTNTTARRRSPQTRQKSTEKPAKSARKPAPKARSPASKKVAVVEQAPNLNTCEDYVRLASHIANDITAAEQCEREQTRRGGYRTEIPAYATLIDVVCDLDLLQAGSVKIQHVKDSGLLGFLHQLAGLSRRVSRNVPFDALQAQKEDCAGRATALLRQWGLLEFKRDRPRVSSGGRGGRRVTSWVDEQSQRPNRQVVLLEGKLYEATSETQLVRMARCPLFRDHYRPSTTHSTKTVESTNSIGRTLTEEEGHWLLDTLLGECFLYGARDHAASTPHDSRTAGTPSRR